jgi:demethoxyubiquinone hydroxylase (CLK1/Coq7/Cat5 family)
LRLTAEDLERLNEVSRPPLIYPFWHQGQFAVDRFSEADWAMHKGNPPPKW